MRTQAKDGQFARDQHLRCNLLVFTSFEIRAGMNGVLARPACRSEQRIQAIGVGPLVGIRNYLAARRLLVFVVFITRQSICDWSNGTSKAATDSLTRLRRDLRTPGASIAGGGPDAGV